MNNQYIDIEFTHKGEETWIHIKKEDGADWWTSVSGFDIHYCEDYNQITVHKSDNNYVTIHKQKIKEQ